MYTRPDSASRHPGNCHARILRKETKLLAILLRKADESLSLLRIGSNSLAELSNDLNKTNKKVRLVSQNEGWMPAWLGIEP